MLKKWLNDRDISTWKLLDWIPDYRAKVARGNGWISLFQTFIPLQYIIPLWGAKLALIDKYPLWLLAIFGIIYSSLFEVVKYIIGHYDMKYGIWERESDYNQTKKEISPFNYKLRKQTEAIGEKLGVKSEFEK